MEETVNKKRNDSMFRDLFGSAEHKENALELYNALNGTNYSDPNQLVITTLEDVIYLNIKNDVSFLLGDEMVLWEHQSTPNPNMPLRGLAYFSKLYSKYTASDDSNVYGRQLVRLPRPRYVVFYTGTDRRPEREEFRLSDAYEGEGDVEVRCEVVNVNPGCSEGIAAACPTLAGYSYFIGRVREYNGCEGMPLREAVDRAIDDCISEKRLAGYLSQKRAEVIEMFLTEFDEVRQRELDRREGYEEGVEQGIERGFEKGQMKILSELVRDGVLTVEEAAERAGMTPEEFAAKAASEDGGQE